MSAVFYKKTKVSDIITKESTEDGQLTGTSTAGYDAAIEQAQKHMDEIGEFMDFHEYDSDDENQSEEDDFSDASSISDKSDFSDDEAEKSL